MFDPAISKLQARGEKAAAKNLIQAKKIYDLKRLRAGVWLLDQAVSKVGVRRVVFNGDSQVTWIKGLVCEMAKRRATK